jgi:hypothetical protein
MVFVAEALVDRAGDGSAWMAGDGGALDVRMAIVDCVGELAATPLL